MPGELEAMALRATCKIVAATSKFGKSIHAARCGSIAPTPTGKHSAMQRKAPFEHQKAAQAGKSLST
jgi:hypothetical protein